MTKDNLRPLAILLLQVPRNAPVAERTRARVEVTARANHYRYAVLEVFELDGNPVKDDATFHAVADLADRTGADALLLSPDVTDQRAGQLARRRQLTVVRVP